MSPATASTLVRDYLEAVRAQLADLDPEEREHLMSDTEAALLETNEPPTLRLGPPERYASELRAAAGLPEASPPRRALLAGLVAHPRVRSARAVAGELAPIWWVARGYVAFTAVLQMLGDDWSARYPGVTAALGEPLGWLLLLAVIAASVALGRRPRTRRHAIVDAALVVATLWLLVAMSDRADSWYQPGIVYEAAPTEGLVLGGRPIDNIYPYDREGRLLQDVRLYDETGAPLDVRLGEGRPRRVVRERSGERVFNSFPVRYFEEGTQRVRRPKAGALDAPPSPIETAAIPAKRR